MTRRTSQLSFANRAICIVLSALLAITMMPAAAFAVMGDYADSAADAQQQSASEFTGSEDQSQQGEYAPDEVIIVYEDDMPDKAEPVSIDFASEVVYAIADASLEVYLRQQRHREVKSKTRQKVRVVGTFPYKNRHSFWRPSGLSTLLTAN